MADDQQNANELSKTDGKDSGYQEPKPHKVVMSIHAHPDDQEFTVGGTLAKWARAGSKIISVIITSGDAGSNDPSKNASYKPELARIREAEQRAACEVLGVQETIFLHYPDGELQATIPLRREITKLIRRYKPDVVVTGDPTVRFYGNSYMNHPDHRAAADVACDSTFPSAGSRLTFADLLDEGYEPHDPKQLYMHGSEKPDTWIDIGETLDAKVQALKEHKSQIGDWDVAQRMREWAAEEGKEKGIPLAESFRVMILVEDEPEKEKARETNPDSAEADNQIPEKQTGQA